MMTRTDDILVSGSGDLLQFSGLLRYISDISFFPSIKFDVLPFRDADKD